MTTIKEKALNYNWILKERGVVNYPDDIIIDAYSDGYNEAIKSVDNAFCTVCVFGKYGCNQTSCDIFKNFKKAENCDNAKGVEHIPSDQMIKKILDLAWEYNASDVEVNNLTEEGEFNYVKQHLSNK